MFRLTTLLRKFIDHSRRHGWRDALGKGMLKLGNDLYTPPLAIHYPEEVMRSLRRNSNIGEHIAVTKEMNERWLRNPQSPRRILWLLPDFRSVNNGAPNTIIRFAHHFAEQGIHNTLVIFNGHVHANAEQVRSEIASAFGPQPNIEVIFNHYSNELNPADLPESDVAVATIWHSAYILLPYLKTKAKFYFIQDYEKLFYAGQVEHALADMTYDFGYLGIFNTPGLRDAVLADHDMVGESFRPGIDDDVFYPGETVQDVNRIFFYGRPDVPRNGFSLGFFGLQQVKHEFPEAEIFIAGHHANWPQTALQANFLPYMDYAATGNLYRQCGTVVSFMFTPHPSYIPLQTMACGCVPIARRDPFTEWALKDRFNCLLIDPVPQQIFEAFSLLRSDPDLHRYLRENAISSFRGIRWRDEMQQIHDWMIDGCRNSAQGRRETTVFSERQAA